MSDIEDQVQAMICPKCRSTEVNTERRPGGYSTCRTCRHKWQTAAAELWALRERVQELEARLGEHKPAIPPTPEKLVAMWRAQNEGDRGGHAEAQRQCADELDASLAFHWPGLQP